MREAAVPGYRLSKARRSTRVLITLGLIGLLIGLLSGLTVALLKSGLAPSSVRAYYLGVASDAAGSLDALMASSPRPLGELAEITHIHVFAGSILLFLLCHLLSLCDASEGLRILLYVISFTTFIATFALPWLIIYVHPVFAWGLAPSVLTLAASLIALFVIPIHEMWFE